MNYLHVGIYTDRTTLKVLDVNENEIGDSGILLITEALKDNNAIIELALGACGLSFKGS